jgi:hypothetical protein
MPVTTPLHWTQTPAGKRKMRKIQKARWDKFHNEQKKETVVATQDGSAKFLDLHNKHAEKANLYLQIAELMQKLEKVVTEND